MVGFTTYIEDSELFKTEKPYRYSGPAIEGFEISNISQPQMEMPLTDIRTLPDFKPTVDSHGFCFAEHKSKELPGLVDESNSQAYADEMAEFLKGMTNAETVFPFNTRLRSVVTGQAKGPITLEAHTDVAIPDGWNRVKGHLTREEQELALSGKLRVRILNLWRPIVNHAEDYPLAVLDPHTVEDLERDVINVDICSPMGGAELAFFRFDSRHRWYWLSNMTPDEVVIFTQWDTHPPNGKFNHVGHGSFRNADARPGCPPRQSVEARFLLLEPAPYPRERPFGDIIGRVDPRRQAWKEFIRLPERTVQPADPAARRKMVFGPPAQPGPAVKVN